MFAKKKRQKLDEYDNEDIQYERICKNGQVLFKCTVCVLYCNTLEQFKLHQKSQKHLKKYEKLMNTSCGVPLGELLCSKNKCEICQIICNTKSQLELHYQGRSHIQKAEIHNDKKVDMLVHPTAIIRNYLNNNEGSCSFDYKFQQSAPFNNDTNNFTNFKQTSLDDVHNDVVESNQFDMFTSNLNTYELSNMEGLKKYDLSSAETSSSVSVKTQKNLDFSKSKSLDETEKSMADDSIHKLLNFKDFEYCDVCKLQLHINNMESHYNGKTHKENMLKMPQTTKVSVGYPIKTKLSEASEHFNNLKLVPRKYQMEIYEKCLNKDCVVFLPTGTGKTFVACMLILKMLENNPYHRVAFIVDKVLLVMQQHGYLKDQYENISLQRFDGDGSVSNRKLRLVGLANSYSNTEHQISIRDHDIVVATAELFRGLLDTKKVFWQEFCLVILDEAHHCVKDHPYNKLMKEYHLYPESVLVNQSFISKKHQNGIPVVNQRKYADWKLRRCKLIGLTASPAGDMDKDNTFILLLELLESLGEVEIVNVTENIEELESFTSNSNIETKLVKYSEEETKFRLIMQTTYFLELQKMDRSFRDSVNYVVGRKCRSLSTADVSNLKTHFVTYLQNSDDFYQTVITHIIKIIDVISALDTFGYEIAWRRLQHLFDPRSATMWLNDKTADLVQEMQQIIVDSCEKESTLVQAILDEGKSVDADSRTILVLVKERETAYQLESILRKKSADQNLILLVGHGAGANKNQKMKNGMSVVKQKKALNLIQSRNNQIIVATSVADEGIDLPDCDLVVLINPPSSVQALVQIRGRARKRSSRLLMICRDKRSIKALNSLRVKETNIIDSITRIRSGRTW